MTQAELANKFLTWFQSTFPDAKIYRNNRGIAWRENNGQKYPVKFGIPMPTGKGKKEKLKGSDYIAFIPEEINNCENCKSSAEGCPAKKILTTQFYELKTANDVLAEGQINFLNLMTEMGAECFLVHEFNLSTKEQIICNVDNMDYGKTMELSFYIEKWSVK